MKIRYLLALTFIFLISCRSIKQSKNFAQCDFSLESIKSAKISGINIIGIKALRDLNPLIGAKLLRSIYNGKFLLETELKIGIKNPNKQTAALSRLDWIAYIEDIKLAEGTIKDKVSVAGLSKTTMPLKVTVDLVKVFKQKDSFKTLKKVLQSFNSKSEKTSFRLKSRPYFEIGRSGKLIKSPIYLKMKRKF